MKTIGQVVCLYFRQRTYSSKVCISDRGHTLARSVFQRAMATVGYAIGWTGYRSVFQDRDGWTGYRSVFQNSDGWTGYRSVFQDRDGWTGYRSVFQDRDGWTGL